MSTEVPQGDNSGQQELHQPEILRVKPGEELPLYPDLTALTDSGSYTPYGKFYDVEGIGQGYVSITRPDLHKLKEKAGQYNTPSGQDGLENVIYPDDMEELDRTELPYMLNVRLQDLNGHQLPHVTVHMKWKNEETGEDEVYEGEGLWDEQEMARTGKSTFYTDGWRHNDPEHERPARPIFFSKNKPEALTEGRIRIIVDDTNAIEQDDKLPEDVESTQITADSETGIKDHHKLPPLEGEVVAVVNEEYIRNFVDRRLQTYLQDNPEASADDIESAKSMYRNFISNLAENLQPGDQLFFSGVSFYEKTGDTFVLKHATRESLKTYYRSLYAGSTNIPPSVRKLLDEPTDKERPANIEPTTSTELSVSSPSSKPDINEGMEDPKLAIQVYSEAIITLMESEIYAELKQMGLDDREVARVSRKIAATTWDALNSSSPSPEELRKKEVDEIILQYWDALELDSTVTPEQFMSQLSDLSEEQKKEALNLIGFMFH